MEVTWQVPNAKIHELKGKTCKYCVLIPVINEGSRIQKQLHELKEYSNIVDIIITDGGSTDNSLDTDFLKSVNVRTLLVKEDTGKLSAQLRIGYAYLIKQGYEGVITIDGNNKDGVDAIPRFIKELDNGYGLVQGSRYVKGGKAINTPLIRDFAIKLIHAPIVSLAAGFRYTDTTNGYRAYSRNYLLDNRVQPFRDIFVNYELLAYLSVRAPRLGYKTKEIPVTRSYPASGKVPTKISHFRGNLMLIRTLLNLLSGKYNPKSLSITNGKSSING
ncbi:glycosyltransferase family 2 protein [Paenibacillus sp. H1-7]|uniref:glycosyltransferase family 2 protein n=1 Tax=Paenibacillus sp. H1-7 TaxID=2282849 RepID=UPI001EF86B0F|nr:glycosyltransferase family 2 protein [Paenibacillus sp. H1-7]ULL19029.1 glycosyltransferase family 2 protein [Paenibacillus sp. H1-7]